MIKSFIKSNSSTLLSVGAGVGVITTAYLSARAGYQTAEVLSSTDPYENLQEKGKRVWKLYIPPAASAAVTIVCVAGGKRVDAKKTIAAQTAMAVAQQGYSEYRQKVIEEFGDKKDQVIRSAIAEEKVNANPPPALIAGSGTVLCCELFTGRYFNSDHDALTKAVNELNSKLLKSDYVTMDEFYYIIGLETTTVSGQCGWESGRLMELEFSSVLRDGKPCLAFDYNYVKSF
jgi:hypothetical protein